MKKLLFLILNFCFIAAMGQNLIRPITISLPPNPKANTADWATAIPPVMIMAQTRMDSGRISPVVAESKILVTIKMGGTVICGSYNQQSAPQSNFNSATKTWSGAAINTLLGKDCILKPGSYELCVQFFSLKAVGTDFGSGFGSGFNIVILGEACKGFTIADAKEQSYSPPQNILPVNGKVFTEQEANMPIMFRWTPVVPKPEGDVLYKLKLIEILPGQNKTEALRTNTPFDILEVKNNTQTSYKLSKRITGLYWEVEAESVERGQGLKPQSYGKSEATSFTVVSQPSAMMAQCNFTPKLDSIYCVGPCGNGKMAYRVRIKLDNTAIGSTLMNFANANNYAMHTPIAAYSNVNTINNLIQAWNTTPSPYGSANPSITATPVAPFYPATIAAGTAPLREVDICVPANTLLPIRLRVFISMISSNGVPGLCDDDVLINTLPPCPCTYCNDNMIVFNGPNQITDAGNILTLNNNISIPGIQVKQFKAELIGISYGPQNNSIQCWVCNQDDNQWGNFTNGTFSSPFPSMVNGVFPSLPCCGGNSHHTIGWWGNPVIINNRPLQLKISLPPASTLSCCPYNITICIRYTFTDVDCRSCSVIRCFSYIRQPQPGPGPGPLPDLNNAVEIVPQNEIRN
jgi:hypothetical protein